MKRTINDMVNSWTMATPYDDQPEEGPEEELMCDCGGEIYRDYLCSECWSEIYPEQYELEKQTRLAKLAELTDERKKAAQVG